MKSTLVSKLYLFLTVFTILVFVNSCEVSHFYDAEITVVDSSGNPKPGFLVTTTVNVQTEYTVYKEKTTNSMGKVLFQFDNLAILKVQADSIVNNGNNYHGEALLVLEEDKTVPITVVVYN